MRLTVWQAEWPSIRKWPCDFYPKRSVMDIKVRFIQLRFCIKLTLIAFFLAAPTLKAQSSAVHAEAAPSEQHLRSRLFIYDLHDGSSHLLFTADSIWEAPNWSPDGKYLIANSGGGIYKLVLKQDGTAEPQRLAVPANFQCNNDKAISPDGKKIAFSAPLFRLIRVRRSFSQTLMVATSS